MTSNVWEKETITWYTCWSHMTWRSRYKHTLINLWIMYWHIVFTSFFCLWSQERSIIYLSQNSLYTQRDGNPAELIRIVSRTPHALNCSTTLWGLNLHKYTSTSIHYILNIWSMGQIVSTIWNASLAY